MNGCQCKGVEMMFNQKSAVRELKQYRRKGPNRTTQMLIDALKTEGIEGMTLLDIGGGVGAIQHELLSAGVRSAANVDASATLSSWLQRSRRPISSRSIESSAATTTCRRWLGCRRHEPETCTAWSIPVTPCG